MYPNFAKAAVDSKSDMHQQWKSREIGLSTKLRQSQEWRNRSLIEKKRSSAKRQILPEIQSPFLKKTVYNLFPKGNCEFSPVKQNSSGECFEKFTRPILRQGQKSMAAGRKIFNNIEFSHETGMKIQRQEKIVKSLSESKQQKSWGEAMPQKSVPIRYSLKKMALLATEDSNASKEMIQKLESTPSQNRSSKVYQNHSLTEKRSLREYKHSSFVLKQKIAQSLYQFQKQEIKMVKDYFTEKQKGIRKSMKIQNYAQFFPNIIINIDN